jgi:hypothetical protein
MNMMFAPPPYPVDAMYALVRDAAREVINHTQAPPALVGCSMLASMAVASQANVDVQLPTGLIRPTCLYMLVLGDSSIGKTTVDAMVGAPLRAHDQKRAEDCRQALARYEADMRIWRTADRSLDAKLKEAQKNHANPNQHHGELMSVALSEPRKPAPQYLLHQSITESALFEALDGDGKSIAIMSDEGELVLRGGAMDKMGMLNKAWDGESTMPRARKYLHLRPTNPRVTVSIMVQEEVFDQFWKKRGDVADGSGHLARYLVAWPTSNVGFRRMMTEDHIWAHLPAFHQRISELLDEADARQSSGRSRILLEFSAEAKELWLNVHNELEPQLLPGGEFFSIRKSAAKMLEITGRVAAIFHHFDRLEGKISQETLQRALDVVQWHLCEFRRVFGERHEVPLLEQDKQRVGEFLHRRYWCQGRATAPWNEVRKYNPVRDQARFERSVWELQNEGAIRIEYHARGKRLLHLNPAAFAHDHIV